MLATSITKRFGLATPILNAGMAMIARPELAAAVSNAGGLGNIGCDVTPPEGLAAMIRETRTLTDKAFGVDLIGDFLTDGHIDVLVDERVPLAIFFWSPPRADQVAQLRASGTVVWMQVGTVKEAQDAVALGVDGLVVQGAEGGGHNRAEASTMTLFPRIRRLFPDLPLVAAGGIADGVTMAAALVLGADAVWCGTRFLASVEANAHTAYKRKVQQADVGDTVITSLYGEGFLMRVAAERCAIARQRPALENLPRRKPRGSWIILWGKCAEGWSNGFIRGAAEGAHSA
jgi:NAD(P)H-dependent flavin oxidoreductase YrpB (nitropropane dioxygenase family)